jgi:hypothetical protein
MRLLLFIFIGFSSLLFAGDNILFKGISFSAANTKLDKADILPICNVNANWVSVVPYGFLKDNEITYDSKFQWQGEKIDGIRETVKLCKEQGLKVMMKPHVWIGHGTYTGYYSCTAESDWLNFEKSYREYIMAFVDLAIEEKVDMFSVGTEWATFVETRPKFWVNLIRDVKAKFKGKVTYAANWDDYQKVSFWNELDYIGIDSYFPLSIAENPKLPELIKSWKVIMPILEQFSSSKKRKIVFTEFGFRSTVVGTVSPWEHKSSAKFSEKVQDLAFKSFFQTIWKKDWFKGGFIWKWYHNHEKSGGTGDTDFTPQNKLAEKTIRKYFGS